MTRPAAYVLAASAIMSSTTAFVPMGGKESESARVSKTCRRQTLCAVSLLGWWHLQQWKKLVGV